MAKLKYKFNKETLSFEVYKTSILKRFKRSVGFFVLSVVVAVGCFSIYAHYFDTPKLLSLRRANAELVLGLELLKKDITTQTDKILLQMQLRDNNVYRPTFGLQDVPLTVRNAGFGGVDRYTSKYGKSTYANLLMDCALQLDRLQRKVYVQTMSFDTIAHNALLIEQMAECVPTIQPIAAVPLHVNSYFGVRVDPFGGGLREHLGLDFAGKTGDKIFVTGNGKVATVDYSFARSGYGNCVVIDHGFGYKTRYAHLQTISVRQGQQVQRGEQIGTMGSTGRSVAPHLHYEVLYRNKQVNPLNFFVNDLEPKDLVSIMNIDITEIKGDFD
ncbi:MAG: M23 family metallopeptidase [Prevotellaceae bacterium]|nr:M23 family metallopeptidase [Prevotellaceae bacterium]